MIRFIDSPSAQRFCEVIKSWPQPPLPEKLIASDEALSFQETCQRIRRKLSSARSVQSKTQLEKAALDWLYAFIRLNVKRGRIFNLGEVLEARQADCLGYAKLLTVLGRCCGLNLGIVEVVIDNRGRNVPHTATLFLMADGSRQFIDFWYGSKDIQHKRLGLRVKRSGRWRIADVNYADLKKAGDVTYLPDKAVDAITLYIEGNRSLKQGNFAQAVEQYSQSIRLYPQNTRTYYNRALAYENLGEKDKSQDGYARALKNGSSQIRTLAVQPDDVVDLIQLDEQRIPEDQQHAYLLSKRFINGEPG
jgi:tetratricopeptide (TPR) repeat protein